MVVKTVKSDPAKCKIYAALQKLEKFALPW